MNKTALITGGSRGIGAQCARRLAANGYDVFICYKSNEEGAAAVVSEITAGGGTAYAVRADVTREDEVSRMVSLCEYRLGSVDVLVNNAGISHRAVFDTIEPEQWDGMMDANVKSCYLVSRRVIPLMRNARGGRIINISSVWGIAGASCEVHYSTSKAAVIGFTRALAKELAPSSITVNCIAPGFINTDMNSSLSAEAVRDIIERTPLHRAGEADDIAAAVLFFASSAPFITGQTLCVDGGFIL